MTIAEKLYKSDPDTLLEIIVRYQLEKLARLYFPDMLVSVEYAEEDDKEHEIEKLMKPSSYSGRVERRNGAIIQPHRPVIK
jgi:hypothetical protein